MGIPCRTRALVLILGLLCNTGLLIAQQRFATGLEIDSAAYSAVPKGVQLLRGDYVTLPTIVSLRQFAPEPGNQGQYGTCSGWATGYAGQTIVHAMKEGFDRSEITRNAFSPSFIYNQIRMRNDCQSGTRLIDALAVLKNKGGLPLKDFGYDCEKTVMENDLSRALKHKIIDYRQVASKQISGHQTSYVKKSLAEGRPVVIAMDVANSFFTAGKFWTPDSSEFKPWKSGHAIAVVGYNDTLHGGAFELMNSWGSSWGKDGFTWMRYSDFDFFCLWAYELIDYSIDDSLTVDISGELAFRESTGEAMLFDWNGRSLVSRKTYPTGTLFELRVSNNQPAYVYAISSDTTGKIVTLFPQDVKISPLLPYKKNNVALPDEDSYNVLDSVKGTSYYCFLYSKKALSIDEIIRRTQTGSGGFIDRLLEALEDKSVRAINTCIKSDAQVSFEARSRGKTVLPIIMEIRHN